MVQLNLPAGGKRGLFMTLSVFLLAISLILLYGQLARSPVAAKDAARAVLDIDQVTWRQANIMSNAVRIFSYQMNVSASNNSVYVQERLPFNTTLLSSNLDDYAAFVRNDSMMGKGENITVGFEGFKSGSVFVEPYGAQFHNPNGTFVVSPPAGCGCITAYSINLTMPIESVNELEWQSISNASGPGADIVQVSINVHDTIYSFNQDLVQYISTTGTSRLNMSRDGAGAGYLQFGTDGSLTVVADGADLKALTSFSNPVYVESNDSVSVGTLPSRSCRIRIS
jgi:hypothetical protein